MPLNHRQRYEALRRRVRDLEADVEHEREKADANLRLYRAALARNVILVNKLRDASRT